LFLSLNGHYVLFLGLMKSFTHLNSELFLNTDSMTALLTEFVQHSFEICMRVAMPMIITILFLHVGVGMLSKAVPQMNAFALSLSLNIMVALVILCFGNSQILSINQEWTNDMQEIFAKALVREE